MLTRAQSVARRAPRSMELVLLLEQLLNVVHRRHGSTPSCQSVTNDDPNIARRKLLQCETTLVIDCEPSSVKRRKEVLSQPADVPLVGYW